ncbi:MAG: site-specific integrase [Chloroflexi bacterium]|nr:site-specific integrase [Chloroflexota bacterium]
MDTSPINPHPAKVTSRTETPPALVRGLQFFENRQARCSTNTNRREQNILHHFADYLQFIGLPPKDLYHNPAAWSIVTFELANGFVLWQINRGYAMGTVNNQILTIWKYVEMACSAGIVTDEEYAKIRLGVFKVHNERDFQTRLLQCRLAKKTYPANLELKILLLHNDQVATLKSQPDTPQGCRDGLIMNLLLDCGLRMKELMQLKREDFDLETGKLRIPIPGTRKVKVYRLTEDILRLTLKYFSESAPSSGVIWRGSRKGKHGLTDDPMSERALIERIRTLGERIGLKGLCAKDCKSYWQAHTARSQT